MSPAPAQPQTFEFELPAGGSLHLQTLDEVELLESSKERYEEDYAFDKLNDKVLLGAVLTQQLTLYRAQQTLSGMEPEVKNNKPTGAYVVAAMKPPQIQAAHNQITKASEQIMALEKALGIDKKTRDAGGQHTLQAYLVTLKRAGTAYGIHIADRVKKYESFAMDLRTRLRMLDNLDAEDRSYHGITEKSILDFIRATLSDLEETDKKFAKTKGKLWLGKL